MPGAHIPLRIYSVKTVSSVFDSSQLPEQVNLIATPRAPLSILCIGNCGVLRGTIPPNLTTVRMHRWTSKLAGMPPFRRKNWGVQV